MRNTLLAGCFVLAAAVTGADDTAKLHKPVSVHPVSQSEGKSLRDKCSVQTKLLQHQMYQQYRERLARGSDVPPLHEMGYRVFSQTDDDGKLLYIFALLGVKNGIFVDIGSADGIDSNCANLAIHFGWHGLFLDMDRELIETGRDFYTRQANTFLFPPVFKKAFVTPGNVNELITREGFTGEVDLLSVDIDGTDYWVWDALICIQPKVVIIESQLTFGMRSIVVPYEEADRSSGSHPYYFGASPLALTRLAERKGYRLVGSNFHGYNLIFVHNGLGEKLLPRVVVETVLRHPSARMNEDDFKKIESLRYTVIDSPVRQGAAGDADKQHR